jgi:hypothetical protein
MLAYRMSASQAETWRLCGPAQEQLAHALSELLTTLIEGHTILVVDDAAVPVFVAEPQGGAS